MVVLLLAIAACSAGPQRPIVAVCTCARSTTNMTLPGDASFFARLVPSLLKTILSHERAAWDVRLYVAIDDDDVFFDTHIPAAAGWVPIVKTVVPRRRNRIPFNENAAVAARDNVEYYVRVNDDTEFATSGWLTAGVNALQAMSPPNLGVVGPVCREGNTAILTHDMTHRTHMRVFHNVYYAAEFSAWWIDDWITAVYRPGRMRVLSSWVVRHHVGDHGTRYNVEAREENLLKRAVLQGMKHVAAWAQQCTRAMFTITVLTMNRVSSLVRLLASLEAAVYRGHPVELVIKVDNGPENAHTIRAAEQFVFSHGSKVISVSPRRRGLRQAWIDAWTPSSNASYGIILEDDTEVCKNWFKWATMAWSTYGHRDDIAGLSLQRQTHKMMKPHSATWRGPSDGVPFLYKLVGTIGFLPHPVQWAKFTSWARIIDLDQFDPTTAGVLPQLQTSTWFRELDPSGWWEAYFIHFCEQNGLYTVYALPRGGGAMAVHHQEKGVHFEGGGGADFAVANDVMLSFPPHPAKFGWDGNPESQDRNKGHLTINERVRRFTASIGKSDAYAGNLIPEQISAYSEIAAATQGAVCETGFFKGVSSYVWLASNFGVLHTFDLAFDPRALSGLRAEFGLKRIFAHRGDSKQTIGKLTDTCGLVSIDGDHGGWGPYSDLVAFLPHARCGAPILFDDTFDKRALYGTALNDSPAKFSEFYNACSRSYWRAVKEGLIAHVKCTSYGYAVATEAYPKGYCHGTKICRRRRPCDTALVTPTISYGQTGNQILHVANALRGGKTVGLDAGWSAWYEQLLAPHPRVLLHTTSCTQSIETYAEYERLHSAANYHAVHPELQALKLHAGICRDAKREYPFLNTSVHLRRLSGQCKRRIIGGETFCAGDARADTTPCVWSAEHFDNSVVAFSDSEAPHLDATFARLSSSPFYVQACAMTQSAVHYGNPASSLDYVIAHWRGARPTLPRSCWRFGMAGALARAVGAHNTVVATMATDINPLLGNFLHYAPHAVVFTPERTPSFAAMTHHIPTRLVPSVSGTFGDSSFFQINAVKPQLILKILLAGYNATWADADVAINRVPVYRQPTCDIFSSVERGSMCPSLTSDVSCAGFLHFRHTRQTINFVTEWARRAKSDQAHNDQCHFQQLAASRSVAHVCHLDPKEYANGHMWVPDICRASGTCLTPTELQNAKMVHANYIIGVDSKIAALKRAGYWYAPRG